MTISEEAIQYLEDPSRPTKLVWINPEQKGGKSGVWKAKIFQDDTTELQFAIYNRKTHILILLEHKVDGVPNTSLLEKRRKSSALNLSGTNFKSEHSGFCYKIDKTSHGKADLPSLENLVTKYLDIKAATIPDISTLSLQFDQEVLKSLADSSAARKSRLATAPKKPSTTIATTTVFKRNPDVVAEVLQRAIGICEGCGSAAPFNRRSTGSPYLEVHHKTPLVDDGDDTVDNAIALCPNCHRQKHYG